MKKYFLVALFAALPVLAQDCPDKPACCPKHPACFGKMHRPHGPRPQLSEEQKAEMKAKFEARKAEVLAKFDADKDGKLSKEERKAAHEARKAEMKAKFMEKFDADKDGQLSDAEKEAVKAEFQKRAPKFNKRGHKGPRCGAKRARRPHGPRCGAMPQGPRPQLSEEQKAEMKAKFQARVAEMKAKLMEKFDADKDGQLSDAEKEAVKADFQKHARKFQKRGPKGPRCGAKHGRRPHGQRPCGCKCKQK